MKEKEEQGTRKGGVSLRDLAQLTSIGLRSFQ